MSRRRRRASETDAPAAEALSEAAGGEAADAAAELPDAGSTTDAPAAEALDAIDVSELGAPSAEWVNRSTDTVRIELCSLDSAIVHDLSIAPGRRLRAPAIYADMVRTRAPQMILEG